MKLQNQKGLGIIWLVIVLAVLGISVVGYFVLRPSSNGSEQTNNPEIITEQPDKNPDTTTESVSKGAVIMTSDSEFGPMLFDDKKQAIYIWELEDSTTAECYGDCAEAWPPVLTDGQPIASAGVNSELLGTTERTDGSNQVTYNGHPLYYYAHEGPGEVKCHNISTHGGLWWVIQPDGNRVK